MATHYEATWDSTDDFVAWTKVGAGSDITFDRVTAPALPWLGGAGRARTTWTAGVGAFSFTATPPSQDTPGRKKRWAVAMNVRQHSIVGDAEGPWRVTARDNGGAPQGEWFELVALGATDSGILYLFNADTFDLSAESVDLRRFFGEWLVFDFSCESTGSSAPYTLKCWCDVWVERAGRLLFVTRLKLPDSTGIAFDFDKLEFSYAGLSKNVDAFEYWIDELRVEEGGGSVPLPRPPSRAADAYPVKIRIRKWDRATSAWKSAWEIDPRAIVDVNCSFLAYRVEDRCEVELLDPGRYSSTALQDVLDDLEQNARALYRLDVMAPDTTHRDPQFPSTWRDDMIYWSGRLVRREPSYRLSDRGVKLAAVGWTEHLKSIAVTKKHYYKQTVNAILTNVLASVTSWPGAMQAITRSGGFDTLLKIPSIGWDNASLYQVLQELADLCGFFFGVSVSGWPSYELTGSQEFRLVFVEPHADADVAPAAGLGEDVGIYFDAANDRRITDLSILCDDSRYANRWDVVGRVAFVDLFSVVVGTDATKVYDDTAYETGDVSGLSLFEGTLAGFSIVLVDFARREFGFIDPDTKEEFKAGRLEPVPSSFLRLDGDSEFPVYSIFERPSPAVLEYNVGQLPAHQQITSADLTDGAIRYILRSNGVRVQRTIRDAEDDSSTGRESIGQRISNGEVRGWQQAGVLALQSRYIERRSAEQARLTVHGWTRSPNGSRYQLRNLVAVAFGAERSTLLGTTAQGGDNWIYGSDERTVGGARTFEVRGVNMRLIPGSGWKAEYTLAAAPRDLVPFLLPEDRDGG